MPYLIVAGLFAGGVLLGGTGHLIDKTGEAADDIASAAIKAAIVGVAGMYAYKKFIKG